MKGLLLISLVILSMLQLVGCDRQTFAQVLKNSGQEMGQGMENASHAFDK